MRSSNGEPNASLCGASSQLACPRCGLTLAIRIEWLAIEHCPRCLALGRALVELQPAIAPPKAL
jgi:hypothetical protein